MTDCERFEQFILSRPGYHKDDLSLCEGIYFRGRIKLAFDAWQAATKAAQPQWINFNDRMPQGAVPVICKTMDKFGYRIAVYIDGFMFTGFDDDQTVLTHWMPIPDAPK